MNNIKYFCKSTKAQAMTEFAICLPIFVLLIAGIFYFGRGYIIKEKSLLASRYSAWKASKYGKNKVDETAVANIFFKDQAENVKNIHIDGASGTSNVVKKMESFKDLETNSDLEEVYENVDLQNDEGYNFDLSSMGTIAKAALEAAGVSIGRVKATVTYDYNSSYFAGMFDTHISSYCVVYNNYNPKNKVNATSVLNKVQEDEENDPFNLESDKWKSDNE